MAAFGSSPCEQGADLLARAEDLSAGERIALERHLAACERCEEAYWDREMTAALDAEVPLLDLPPLRWDLLSAHLMYGSRVATLAASHSLVPRAAGHVAMAWLDLWARLVAVWTWLTHQAIVAPLPRALAGAASRELGGVAAVGRSIGSVVMLGARVVGASVAIAELLLGAIRLGGIRLGGIRLGGIRWRAVARGMAIAAGNGGDVWPGAWPAHGEESARLDTDVIRPLAQAGLACFCVDSSRSFWVDNTAPADRAGPYAVALSTRRAGAYNSMVTTLERPRPPASRPRTHQTVPRAGRMATAVMGAPAAGKARVATALAHARAGGLGGAPPEGIEGEADGEPDIGEERKAALRAALQRWHAGPGAADGPFAGIRLTGADVMWLLASLATAPGAARPGDATPYDATPYDATHPTPLNLSGARLIGAHLEDLDLRGCNLRGADVRGAYLAGSDLRGAGLSDANLFAADLQQADLSTCHLARADLTGAFLNGCSLAAADLRGACLREARLDGADLTRADLEGANVSAAVFDKATRLCEARLAVARLDQVVFDNVNLAVVDWGVVSALGEEVAARARRDEQGKLKSSTRRLREYQMAARATRHLAGALRAQGLTEPADRFDERAHRLQRAVSRGERRWFSYWSSLAIDAVSGYGYRPLRSVVTYALAVSTFAAAYFALSPAGSIPHAVRDAVLLSITSLHGRGFALDHLTMHTSVATLSAVEAIVGLVIEVLFIVAFTQRFFKR